VVTGYSTEGHAELHSRDVAILANVDSPDSLAVARHYAKQRDIPSTHIIHLSLPDREYLSRDEYDRLVVTPVRQALEKAGLASTTRVLVTTYGVPLRVAAHTLSADEKRWRSEAQTYVRVSRNSLEDLQLQLTRMNPGLVPQEPGSDQSEQAPLEMARTAALLPRVEYALRASTEKRRLSTASPQETQRLLQLIQRYGGWGMLLQRTKPAEEPPEVAAWRTLLERTSPLWAELGHRPITTQRALIYRWAERLFGLRGVLELASAEVDLLDTAYADASLDSELALLWWDRELAPLAWRQPNALFAGADAPRLPLLMVSRLDAPTPDLARGLVDKALLAEREGLRGIVYFDARGLTPKNPTDTYGHYDQSLREAADFVRRETDYRVVLDNREQTFTKPGDAPDVALYIGWYKLRAYEDAFGFKPGAVGYHMASAEALSVHDPDERGWCKNALGRGITVTLGSVGEPYLDAFPEPAEFVKLLLSGRYALVEAYALTSRYVGWRMALFGDPLYNPFRGRGRASPSASDRLPPAPSDRPTIEPVAALDHLKQERKSQMAQLIKALLDADAATNPAR
jgi:uncharacterized protein (TIGR03790 family)